MADIDMTDAVEEARESLVEAAAEGDDDLIEKYLETLELSDEEVLRGLTLGVAAVGWTLSLYPMYSTSVPSMRTSGTKSTTPSRTSWCRWLSQLLHT